MRPTLVLSFLAAATVQALNQLVDVGYARYQGFVDGDVTKWYGVRYAAPPIGNNRFRGPQDPEPIPGIVNATKVHILGFEVESCSDHDIQQGPICPPQQNSDYTLTGGSKRFTVDEDCLFLSVAAPSNAQGRPVLFWMQGGGFGSNSNANYNASALASDGDIVVVQIVSRTATLSRKHPSKLRH